ncbi:hypothetical protein M513_00992 [Trichuris suis]|uniref:Uncharacterized protein n=1 Tax=Trichuris suis TaxID=68888 RepID=A0A085MLY3_9BILA|nr:hypothetical protein M513_00992 [Trichuris suis]
MEPRRPAPGNPVFRCTRVHVLISGSIKSPFTISSSCQDHEGLIKRFAVSPECALQTAPSANTVNPSSERLSGATGHAGFGKRKRLMEQDPDCGMRVQLGVPSHR